MILNKYIKSNDNFYKNLNYEINNSFNDFENLEKSGKMIKIILYFTLSWISLCPGFWPKIQDNVMDTKNIKINIYFFKFNNTY